MSSLQQLYESPWQHPGIAFSAGAFMLVAGPWTLRRSPRRAFAVLFVLLELEILVDAWLTGALTPVGAIHLGVVSGVFAVLGDLRFFYLVERQVRARAASVLVALPISLVVPLTTGLVHTRWPALLSDTRLYLAYEVALLCLSALFVWLRARRLGGGRALYLRRLLAFEAAQYALWSIADLLILSGHDLGFLLRVIPNALYYACFVPLATLRVPDGVRA